MPNLILMMLGSLLRSFRTHAAMQAEIIALRRQLVVLQRTQKTKRFILRRGGCGLAFHNFGPAGVPLIIVKPATVIGWHRQGFRWYWTWKIRHGRTGRPRVAKETRDLIRSMSRMNVL